ncbi:hypothetical protein [Micromonospora coxensis]|uniref:CopC domain-containing protein n=1 Tax=Micromonospora coxensis TaxID=356852 RepID=A0A1C5GVA5_9ACTN|nr:hypothetical protein [Micromonospora coxensis]SCG37694.1 hypothetical protein GA0070614_0423 [Micromonospora coxensis]
MPTKPRPVRAAVLTALLLALVVGWPDPAHAHRGVVLHLHHDGRGTVRVDMAWTDGHPVTGPASAVLLAQRAGGRSVGPVGLRAVIGSGPTTLTLDAPLADGRWTVTVDAASPGLGQCVADLVVGPDSPAQSITCGSITAPTVTAAAPPAGGGLTVPIAGAALLIILGLARYARHRRPGRSGAGPC